MVRGGGGWLFLLQLLCVRHNNAFSYQSFAQKWMAMWRFFVWSNLGYLWPGEVEVVCGRRKCFGFKVLQRNFAQRLGSFLVGCVIAFSRVRWETLMDVTLWTRIWRLGCEFAQGYWIGPWENPFWCESKWIVCFGCVILIYKCNINRWDKDLKNSGRWWKTQ